MDDGARGSDTALPEDRDAEADDVSLNFNMAGEYRRLAATVLYMSADRPDLQFVASVLGRTMAAPTERN